MNKLIVCFPVYHQVPATFFTRYLGMDKTGVMGNIVVDGVYLPISMAMMVKAALKIKGWDRLVVMEADTIPPLDAFERVGQYTQDIVGSMYFGHNAPHSPMVFVQEEGNLNHNQLTPKTVKDWCNNPGLYEVSAVGFGFTSIARPVLEDWDKDRSMFEYDKSFVDFGSHDLWFCYQARQQGYKVFVDSGIQCGHLTEVAIELSHNQELAPTIADKPVIEFAISKGSQFVRPPKRSVLNVGAGTIPIDGNYAGWQETKLDIDPRVKPDIVGDAINIIKLVSNKKYDAIYSSHTIEHFKEAKVISWLKDCYKILKDNSEICIKTPDIGEVKRRLAGGVNAKDVAYNAPVGPITYNDILHGYSGEIEKGNIHYRHLSGFDKDSLYKALASAGFTEIIVDAYNLELKAVGHKTSVITTNETIQTKKKRAASSKA